MRIACDTGGTFTDLIVEEGGVLQMFKTSTVPSDPVKGVLNGLELIAKHYEIPLNKLLARVDTFIHATTRSINAVLTGNTAKLLFLLLRVIKIFYYLGKVEELIHLIFPMNFQSLLFRGP